MDTPSESGTPFPTQTPREAAELFSPNSLGPTPADFLATPDYAATNTPHPNTVRNGSQYVNRATRARVFSSDQSSPLTYPGGFNPPSAPRVDHRVHYMPEELDDSELETPRRSFQRGDIHPTTFTQELRTPTLGSTPYTPFAGSTIRPFQEFTSPNPVAPSPGQSVETPLSEGNSSTQVIWGTTINIQAAMNEFRDFLENFSEEHMLEHQGIPTMDDGETKLYYPKLIEEMKETQQVNLNLDCQHLVAYSGTQSLYHQLKRYPQEIIPLMDFTLTKVFVDRFGIDDLTTPSLRVRPFNLSESVNMRELNPSDIDQLVTIKGLLIRASQVLPDLKTAFFKCFVCDHCEQVGIDRGVVAEPTVCPRQECQSANSMQLIHNRSVFADKQVCKLQETPDNIPDGQTPHSVSMCVYDDLVDAAKPGDRLEVTGIFRSVPIRVNPRMRTIKALFRTYLDVVHIKTVSASRVGGVHTEASLDSEQDPALRLSPAQEQEMIALSHSDDLYQRLSHSLAPSIFGLDDVKKGVLLQLFGGSNNASTNHNTRGDVHVLLVGDPGTSKSQLLQYAHRIAPRGMYTSGKGSSAVGLTAYITRDPDTNQLVLESGALVLSDGGLCCIDEFDKMGDSTRSILHEVMEQQTVSVAKAGIITTLNARTSILACANPINSQWMRSLSVPENINLPPSLLSRFDLVYLMLDTADKEEDRRLARHLVSLYLNPSERTTDSHDKTVPTSLLTRYIAYAKARINPKLTKEAGAALVNKYISLRQAGVSSTRQETRITATTRQLESMIRLAEAHARMRLQDEVQVVDVEEASRLIREAVKESATDPRTGLIDWDILATGIGSHSRRTHPAIKAGVVEILGQPPNAAYVPVSELLSELNRRAVASGTAEISPKDLSTVIMELHYNGLVELSDSKLKVCRKFLQGYTISPSQL